MRLIFALLIIDGERNKRLTLNNILLMRNMMNDMMMDEMK